MTSRLGSARSANVETNLDIRAWWHRNGQPIPSAPAIEAPTFLEAVAEVRALETDSEFNSQHAGNVPGLTRWQPANA
jgi:hypothetical protein